MFVDIDGFWKLNKLINKNIEGHAAVVRKFPLYIHINLSYEVMDI